jgi:hypothetical protein
VRWHAATLSLVGVAALIVAFNRDTYLHLWERPLYLAQHYRGVRPPVLSTSIQVQVEPKPKVTLLGSRA